MHASCLYVGVCMYVRCKPVARWHNDVRGIGLRGAILEEAKQVDILKGLVTDVKVDDYKQMQLKGITLTMNQSMIHFHLTRSSPRSPILYNDLFPIIFFFLEKKKKKQV